MGHDEGHHDRYDRDWMAEEDVAMEVVGMRMSMDEVVVVLELMVEEG